MNNIETTVGPRHTDLSEACRGTITKLQRKEFLAWSISRVPWHDLVDDTMSNTIVALDADGRLPIPLDLNIAPYVNAAAALAFKRWRTFFKVDQYGNSMATSRSPLLDVEARYGGWDIYRPEQFIFNGVAEVEGNDQLTLSIVERMHEVLTDEQMDLVQMLSDGATYDHIARELAPEWVESGRRPSDWVNARMRTIRSRVTGLAGSVTQAQAGEWLDRQRNVVGD